MNYSVVRSAIFQILSNDSTLRDELAFKDNNPFYAHQNMDAFFLITMAIHIHMMQCGFALLETGCVRAQSATNSMWKNCISAYAAAIGFWLFGYAIAFGKSVGGFVGSTFWAWHNIDDINLWFFQFSFCATASTIISGAIAERAHILAFSISSLLMSSFYYPFMVHWCWNKEGWLHGRYLDFGGSGIVHLGGGAASLAAVLVVGARHGRYTQGRSRPIHGHSTTVGINHSFYN